jgi:hypothetical protein
MYSPSADPIVAAQDFSITVMVHDSDKVTMLMDASVDAIDVTMPEMGHGMPTSDQVTITDNNNGTFTIEPMNFMMAGYWKMVLTVSNGNTYDFVTFHHMQE